MLLSQPKRKMRTKANSLLPMMVYHFDRKYEAKPISPVRPPGRFSQFGFARPIRRLHRKPCRPPNALGKRDSKCSPSIFVKIALDFDAAASGKGTQPPPLLTEGTVLYHEAR